MTVHNYMIVGHGGQGVLDLGNFIAYNSLDQGLHVAYTPSYGPETRGGKVRCYVVTSDQNIDSPIIDHPDVLVAMNNPSMDFESLAKSKGLFLMNLSLINRIPQRKDLEIFGIPATDIAYKLKGQGVEMSDTRVLQNSVMYGATLAALAEPFDQMDQQSVLGHVYSGEKTKFIPANLKAIKQGYYFVQERKTTNPVHTCGL